MSWTPEGQPFDPQVRRVGVESTEDASGVEALLVHVFIDSEQIQNGDLLAALRAKLQERLAGAGVHLWPYVRFEDATEGSPG